MSIWSAVSDMDHYDEQERYDRRVTFSCEDCGELFDLDPNSDGPLIGRQLCSFCREIPFGYCRCGCGLKTSLARQNHTASGWVKGQPLRYIRNHGGRKLFHKGQYRSGSGTLRAHVEIAEKALGRKLPPRAEVHHVDENKHNNAPTNLVICQDRAYHMLLHVRARILKRGGNPNTDKVCTTCKKALPNTVFYSGANQCKACSYAITKKRRESRRLSLQVIADASPTSRTETIAWIKKALKDREDHGRTHWHGSETEPSCVVHPQHRDCAIAWLLAEIDYRDAQLKAAQNLLHHATGIKRAADRSEA